MKRVVIGMTVIAASIIHPAQADPRDANLWVGLENSRDGVLINEQTGEAWLTGICLKPLSKAERSGEIWQSRTVETVSIGRSLVRLDQTFTLDTRPEQPSLTVDSVDRGAPQSFAAVIEPACQSSSSCRALLDAPAC